MASPIERVQQRTGEADEQLRVLDIREPRADEVLDALAPEMRRRLYRALFAEPQTTSELAERLDTSIQNVQYHLDTLRETELIEEVDTVYSAKGNEMTVFAPANDPLVFVGNADTAPRIERSLKRVLAGLGLVGVASLLVQWVATRLVAVEEPAGSVVPASPGAAVAEPSTTLTWLVFGTLEPGIVFFFGAILVAIVAMWLRKRGSPPDVDDASKEADTERRSQSGE